MRRSLLAHPAAERAGDLEQEAEAPPDVRVLGHLPQAEHALRGGGVGGLGVDDGVAEFGQYVGGLRIGQPRLQQRVERGGGPDERGRQRPEAGGQTLDVEAFERLPAGDRAGQRGAFEVADGRGQRVRDRVTAADEAVEPGDQDCQQFGVIEQGVQRLGDLRVIEPLTNAVAGRHRNRLPVSRHANLLVAGKCGLSHKSSLMPSACLSLSRSSCQDCAQLNAVKRDRGVGGLRVGGE